jgi:hypothetical protein
MCALQPTGQIWRRSFHKEAVELAIRGGAQAMLLFWGAGDLVLDLWETNWQGLGSAAVAGFLLSYLTSIAANRVGSRSTARFSGNE